MKAYTDLEQSKKLAEILPLESADMFYRNNGIDVKLMWEHIAQKVEHPCWSLAALLAVYPMVVGRDMDMFCCWQNSKGLHSRHYDNPVDTCYEMIIKLHELNLL